MQTSPSLPDFRLSAFHLTSLFFDSSLSSPPHCRRQASQTLAYVYFRFMIRHGFSPPPIDSSMALRHSHYATDGILMPFRH
jgi:hypothetical protein